MANTCGTGKFPDRPIATLVRQVFPLSPQGMIDHLKLREPGFRKTACYGHFGRPEFTWERVDAIEELQEKSGKIWP